MPSVARDEEWESQQRARAAESAKRADADKVRRAKALLGGSLPTDTQQVAAAGRGGRGRGGRGGRGSRGGGQDVGKGRGGGRAGGRGADSSTGPESERGASRKKSSKKNAREHTGRSGGGSGATAREEQLDREFELKREIMRLKLEKEEAELRADLEQRKRREEGRLQRATDRRRRDQIRQHEVPQAHDTERRAKGLELGHRLAAQRQNDFQQQDVVEASQRRQESDRFSEEDQRRLELSAKLRAEQEAEAMLIAQRRRVAAARESPEQLFEAEQRRRATVEAKIRELISKTASGTKPKPRPAVSSEAASLDDLYETLRSTETELKLALSDESSSDTVASLAMRSTAALLNMRKNIRNAGAEILARDPEFGVQKGVLELLWNVFYKEMKDLEKQVKGHQPGTDERAASLDQLAALHREVCNFYLTLTLRCDAVGNPLGVDLDGGSEPASSKVVCACVTALGDAGRYYEIRGDHKRKDFSHSITCYRLAHRFSCTSGKVHNLLGVIATYEHSDLAAAAYYSQSLCAVMPFNTDNNLLSLLKKVAKRTENGVDTSKFRSSEYHQSVLHTFEQLLLRSLHGILDSKALVRLSEVRPLAEQCAAQLQSLYDLDLQPPPDTMLLQAFILIFVAVIRTCNSQEEDPSTSVPHALYWGSETENAVALLLIIAAPVVRAAGDTGQAIGPVSVLLDWLAANPDVMNNTCSVLVGAAWAALRNELKSLFSEATLTAGSETAEGMTPEDVELRGLAFMAKIVAVRMRKQRHHGKGRQMLPPEAAARVTLARLRRFASQHLECVDPRLHALACAGRAIGSAAASRETPVGAQSDTYPESISTQSREGGTGLSMTQMEAQWQLAFSASNPGTEALELAGSPTPVESSGPPALWEPPEPEPAKHSPQPTRKPVKSKKTPASAPAPPKAQGGVLVGVDLDSIMPKVGESKRAEDVESRMIVLDAPNIAMRHGTRGNSKKFSCAGIKLAIDYYQNLGHKVIGFIPDFYLSYENAGKHKRAADIGVGDVRASKTPDDIALLRRLMDEGTLAATPPQDYDDSYCIQYAMSRKGAVIITNDLYRDAVDEVDGKANKNTLRMWFRTHCCSYTFVADEFLPNPDFKFPPAG